MGAEGMKATRVFSHTQVRHTPESPCVAHCRIDNGPHVKETAFPDEIFKETIGVKSLLSPLRN